MFVDLTNAKPSGITAAAWFFHPTNSFLYWTDGDSADGDNDQILNKTLYSGVFRIDVDCIVKAWFPPPSDSTPTSRMAARQIISSQMIIPFVGQSNVLEEFFCLGLRSPHRMTYRSGRLARFSSATSAKARAGRDGRD